ncbi:MAG TPA: ATP-dependent RecD-like DNA helicase [Proteiniclasticum sp.]|uniref:SF1B family DNA helicase RecD2 n=1 Tax=Proteiniclasticum sp. TaxID=2053595 RepID=UPI000E95AF40|nr:ATP-dependent RecD-like DNA helicase [Proteiniclasticum sp.]HBW12787.1 ATP-dependent RecD-like DNA helicase [Proteiniclasticum sp.]
MERLEGVVRDIVFQNEESAFCIIRIEDEQEVHTALGTFPYISVGQTLVLHGESVLHATFGKQFKCESYEEVVPSTMAGIEKYLSSGAVAGIGPITAKKLVEKFGAEIFSIIENEPEKLKELDGIGDKKVRLIYESYIKGREVKNIMVFLQSYGVTPKQALKIYRVFGNESVAKVKENPYILSDEVPSIGFKTADKIARNLGITLDSPFRIQSGIKYIINEYCAQGSTFIPKEMLLEKGQSILEVRREELEENILHEVMKSKLMLERIGDVEGVFTMPYLYAEISVTKHMLGLLLEGVEGLDIPVKDYIQDFEKKNGISFHDKQIEAITGAAENGIEIITGGPGTGKTTIIKCILNIFERAGKKVLMGAPTGRAAKRMSEATGRESKTIHRLIDLSVSSEEDEVLFDEDETLNCDVVIIDEASMIDVMLMNNLLKAIKPKTRLILVGDVDQLPSVGAGKVLEDIIDSGAFPVVKLQFIYRQGKESFITTNAHRINTGVMPVLNAKESDFFFIQGNDSEDSLQKVIELVTTRLPKFNEKWDRVKDFQILTPMRKGELGVYNLNLVLQKALNPRRKKYSFTDLQIGDKVMQTKNNYMIKWRKVKRTFGEPPEGQGIFNGDIGYVTDINEEDNTVSVLFDEDKIVEFESQDLDELELAYAVTIHKSQGSEFKVVLVPLFMGPPLLMSRNLIYTAVTRARELIVLVGSQKALSYMIKNTKTYDRHTSLKYRIMSVMDNVGE